MARPIGKDGFWTRKNRFRCSSTHTKLGASSPESLLPIYRNINKKKRRRKEESYCMHLFHTKGAALNIRTDSRFKQAQYMGHSRYLLVCPLPIPFFFFWRKKPCRLRHFHPRHGLSEEIIGKAIKKYNIPRSKIVILSKCFFGVQPGKQPPVSASATNDGEMVNQVGLSRKHIFDAVEGSVNRLGTYIDVLQIHRLDRDTPKEEIMKALNDVVESGKVRYLGASSVGNYEQLFLRVIV